MTNSDFFGYLKTAEDLYNKFLFHEALDIYKRLLKFRLETVDDLSSKFNSNDAIIVERLADLSLLFNKSEIAEELLAGLQQLLQENGNTYVYIYIALKRADIALKQGGLKQTYNLLETLVDFIGNLGQIDFERLDQWENQCNLAMLLPEEKQVVKSRVLYVMGVLLLNLGQYCDGIRSLLYGLKKLDDPSPLLKVAIIPYKLEISRAYLEKGELETASSWLLNLTNNDLVKNSINHHIATLELSAKFSLVRGELGSASETLVRLKALCSKYKLHYAEIGATINLANVKIFVNQVALAQELLDEADGLCGKVRALQFATRISFTRKLALYRSISQVPSVSITPSLTDLKREPISTSTKKPEVYQDADTQAANFLVFFEDRAARFQMTLSDRHFDKARGELENMKKVFLSTDSILIRNRLTVLSYMLSSFTRGKFEADSRIKEARLFFEQQQMKPELSQLYRLLSANADSVEQKEKLVSLSMNLIEEISGSLTNEEQTIFLLNKWTVEEEYLSNKMKFLFDLEKQKEQSRFFKRQRVRIQLFKGIYHLLYQIDAHKQKVVQKVISDKLLSNGMHRSIDFLKEYLLHPNDHVTISFLVLPDQVITVYKSRFMLGIITASVTRIELRTLVRTWHELTLKSGVNRHLGFDDDDTESNDAESIVKELSGQIAQKLKLIEILNLLPKGVKRITVVPDDVLIGFPFSSITYEGRYLIERFALSIDFRNNHVYANRVARNVSNKVLFAYVSEGEQGKFQPLPGAKNEIKQIEEIIKTEYRVSELKVLPDKEVTKKRLLSELNNAKIAHIACHGAFDGRQPDNSGLVLLNNERLTLKDIAENPDFTGLQHITLSSCWGADRFILPGRWVISLPETFYRSGVRSVLACSWEVNDSAAVAFMKTFYQYASSLPKDIALQRAQIESLNNRLPGCSVNTSNVFYWSGFTLFGDVVSFDGRKRKRNYLHA